MVCLWNEPRRLGRNKKRKKISDGMVETRSQKVSEDKSTTLKKRSIGALIRLRIKRDVESREMGPGV